ncbi:MAG: hypothetical protein PUC33_08210 [Oscillospiraceae bacterium]|nr:hypothetical protein [Oscillospiraceae bacterium]
MKKKCAVQIAKKILKSVFSFKFITSCIFLGATVYSLIPRYDTIDGIDTDTLIQNCSPEVSEAPCPECEVLCPDEAAALLTETATEM